MQALDPTYQPPAQFAYKNSKLEDRVDVPQVSQLLVARLAFRFLFDRIQMVPHYRINKKIFFLLNILKEGKVTVFLVEIAKNYLFQQG